MCFDRTFAKTVDRKVVAMKDFPVDLVTYCVLENGKDCYVVDDILEGDPEYNKLRLFLSNQGHVCGLIPLACGQQTHLFRIPRRKCIEDANISIRLGWRQIRTLSGGVVYVNRVKALTKIKAGQRLLGYYPSVDAVIFGHCLTFN